MCNGFNKGFSVVTVINLSPTITEAITEAVYHAANLHITI